MGNYIFIPENEKCLNFEDSKKGAIHYKLNTPIYKAISWTSRQKLIYKIQTSQDWNFEKEMLSADEEMEYKKLFDKINETPQKNILKKCILVIVAKTKCLKLAIGLEVIDGNNYVVFKSGSIDEIKQMCKNLSVSINYDNKLCLYLLNSAYLNEIIPQNIWEYVARKYIKIEKRDKVFSKKLKEYFDI